MNFLLTIFLFLFQCSNPFCMPWWLVGLIFAGLGAFIVWLWKKGMIKYGRGTVPKGTVHTVEPPK